MNKTEEIIKIIQGDCLEKLKELEDNSVDSIVTDPPYELGFMGKSWDNTGIANNVEMWKECLRVLKPGGHLLAFSGTRTYHRMASAIEDAGFEVRDMIEWVYGSGFPKSLNIGKKVDELQGNEREVVGKGKGVGGENLNKLSRENGNDDENAKSCGAYGKGAKQVPIEIDITKGTSEWEGWGTALKPAHEPICMARKPLSEKNIAENCLKWGTGGINIDESRISVNPEIDDMLREVKREKRQTETWENGSGFKNETNSLTGVPINGRFPANLIHDNSEEVRECFPNAGKGNGGKPYNYAGKEYNNKDTSMFNGDKPQAPSNFNDSGNASRFFKSIIYTPKASKAERNRGCEGLEEKPKVFNGQSDKPSTDMKDVEKRFTTLPKANNHPTVKPIALMEYLIKMVTPKGGVVLDPFTGSGSTGVACKKNGFGFIGIELEPDYCKIAEQRLAQEVFDFTEDIGVSSNQTL